MPTKPGFDWDPILEAYIPIDKTNDGPEVEKTEETIDTNPSNTEPEPEPEPEKLAIAKPTAGSKLERFKSKRKPTVENVQTLLTALPHYRIAEARDFVRFHPNEDLYWSSEFCFVTVPIQGQKRDLLHLIDEELGMQYLPSKKIQRFRLALATKPYDKFFLGHVPSQNLDNKFNETALRACLEAKQLWVEVTSRKEEGIDEYKINLARNQKAFPEPKWPSQTLDELIEVTFNGRQIEDDNHPALLRLIGDVQSLS